MSADVVANPPSTTTESKSARKKKAKAEATTAAVATPVPVDSPPASYVGAEGSIANGVDGSSENSYIKELQKQIKNINKKLTATAKTDAVIAANPGVSLDDLHAERKINADQKAQALRKPALQATLASLEEQLVQYKKIDQEYQEKLAAKDELLQSAHKSELDKLREVVRAEVLAEEKLAIKQRYLNLSKFLHAAAAKRQDEAQDPTSAESLAFEGLLLLVYGANPEAVDAIEKVVEGSDDVVKSIENVPTGVSYSAIRQIALDTPVPFANEQAWAEGVAEAQGSGQEEQAEGVTEGDPTIANAGLTELNTTGTTLVNGHDESGSAGVPAASGIGADAANNAAEQQWDQAGKDAEDPLAESYEIIPRDPTEVETPAEPAAATSTQSWAEEAQAEAAAVPPVVVPTTTDEFHEVHRTRGGRGGRGDGPGRGEHRGRGRGRGDGRGRGGFRPRGDGGRGPRGGHRGGRGRGESGPPPNAPSAPTHAG